MLRLVLVISSFISVATLLGVASHSTSLPAAVSNRPTVTRLSVAGKRFHQKRFRHPYIKELYKRITYKNGSLSMDNLKDDPITIWSFTDIGS